MLVVCLLTERSKRQNRPYIHSPRPPQTNVHGCDKRAGEWIVPVGWTLVVSAAPPILGIHSLRSKTDQSATAMDLDPWRSRLVRIGHELSRHRRRSRSSRCGDVVGDDLQLLVGELDRGLLDRRLLGHMSLALVRAAEMTELVAVGAVQELRM